MRKESVCFITIIVTAFPGNVSADRIFDVEIQDLIILFRYLIGLGFVIFGVFFLLYKDFATKIFLERYDEENKVIGLVVACDGTKGQRGRKYEVQVVYRADPPKTTPQRRRIRRNEDPKAASGPLLQQEYMHKFKSNWMTPQGTILDLYLIPDQPRSAVTKDLLDTKKEFFSWTNALTILIPGCGLAAIFVDLCMDMFSNFPPDRAWVGWSISGAWVVLAVFVSWAICDNQFQNQTRQTFLSSYPVQRRDSNGKSVLPPPLTHADADLAAATSPLSHSAEAIPSITPNPSAEIDTINSPSSKEEEDFSAVPTTPVAVRGQDPHGTYITGTIV